MSSYSILAVETSTLACSVALIYQDKMYQRYELLPQKHAHRLLEMVDEVLSEAGIEGQAIDYLAYGEGPGAFTGVRIAAGVTQGLSLGWDKPVLGISSLEAMAERVLAEHSSEPELGDVSWCALMDARMKEVYLQSGTFNAKKKQWQASEVRLVSPEEAERVIHNLEPNGIGLGDIAQEYPALKALFSPWFDALPTAVSVANIAQRLLLKGTPICQKLALPVYLRNNVADTIEERRLKKSLKQ